ncbi:MAG: short-chain dehydrogenase/reductase [Rugosibacter sp.]
MDFGLRDKTGIVTGASQGIGEAIAHAMAAEGMSLVVCGRDSERLNRLAAELAIAHGVQVFPVIADLSGQQGVDSLVGEAVAALGNIDVLVNNAGAIRGGSLLTKPDAEWQEDWALKVFGYIRLTRAVFPLMQAAGGGRIINIIGQAGRQPKADYLAGGGANAAIMNMTKALGDEGGPHNILVNGISPGPIRTQRWQTLMTRMAADSGKTPAATEAEWMASNPLRRAGNPEEVAALAVFLASRQASYINGAIIPVDGGDQRCI